VKAHGGDRKSENAKYQACTVTSLIDGTADHWLARLDRDRPDLAEKVRSKELSANAAAIRAATNVGNDERERA
jgi:hypothetical protein